MIRAIFVDALGLAYRAHYGAQANPSRDASGNDISAIRIVASWLAGLASGHGPVRGLAWDAPGQTFRHVAMPSYKAHRKPMPPALAAQLDAIADGAARTGWKNYCAPSYEADDVLASLARREPGESLIVSADKDVLQLVNERVRVMRPIGRFGEWPVLDEAAVRELMQVGPVEVPAYLALCGDAADGLPGEPGVGPKGALKRLRAGAMPDTSMTMLRMPEALQYGRGGQ